jgi:hypothetical protein
MFLAGLRVMAGENGEDAVAVQPPERKRERHHRRGVHPLEVIDDNRDAAVGIVGEPQQPHQSYPASQRIRPARQHREIGRQPGARGEGAYQRFRHTKVHVGFGLGTGNHDRPQLRVIRQEPLDQGRFAHPHRAAQINNPWLTLECTARLLAKDRQLATTVDNPRLGHHG